MQCNCNGLVALLVTAAQPVLGLHGDYECEALIFTVICSTLSSVMWSGDRGLVLGLASAILNYARVLRSAEYTRLFVHKYVAFNAI